MLDPDAAAALAKELLGPLPSRWAHTQGVARTALDVAERVRDLDGNLLVAAAWVHDIGYAPSVAQTGFHHLDGAVVLAEMGEPELAGLVAHHTSGDAEAGVRGLTANLEGYEVPKPLVAAALAYCDLHTGSDGAEVDVRSRVADVNARYGAQHPVSLGLLAALPLLQEQIDLMEGLLQSKTG